MATRTRKKYLWRVVECVYYSLDVVAEDETEAKRIYWDNIDNYTHDDQNVTGDCEAYTIKQQPVKHKKGVYNES